MTLLPYFVCIEIIVVSFDERNMSYFLLNEMSFSTLEIIPQSPFGESSSRENLPHMTLTLRQGSPMIALFMIFQIDLLSKSPTLPLLSARFPKGH